MSRMFSFITKTWNPLGGECLHKCTYCWAKSLIKRYSMQKYSGLSRIDAKALKEVFEPTDFVFVCDMTDLFGGWVPKNMIQYILDRVNMSRATYLLLTKNPSRYLDFDIPSNCVTGATIESDIDFQLTGPPQRVRIEAMQQLKHPRKMVSIEPVMDFSSYFKYKIAAIKPEFVAVGYDNYNNGLEEPRLDATEDLIEYLEEQQIKVYRKTVREAICVAKKQTPEPKP